jgi:hypothetical protein
MLLSVTLLSNSFFKETFPYSAMNWRHTKAQQEIRNICFPFSGFQFVNFIYTYIRTHQTYLGGHTVFGHGFELRPRHGYFATFLSVMFQLAVKMQGLIPHHICQTNTAIKTGQKRIMTLIHDNETRYILLIRGYTNFPKIYKPSQNTTRHTEDPPILGARYLCTAVGIKCILIQKAKRETPVSSKCNRSAGGGCL